VTGPCADLRPPAMRSGTMVYDPVRDRLLLIGNAFIPVTDQKRMWEYDPVLDAWRERCLGACRGVLPATLAGGWGGAIDPRRGVIVLYGGYGGGLGDPTRFGGVYE